MSCELMFHDGHEAGDSERTIIVSERDVRAARRLLALLLHDHHSAEVDLTNPAQTRPATDISHAALIARAREEFENRRRRAKIFGRSMFGEPAWDMLLALYLLDSAGPRQTIGSLLQFSGTSSTTAKRWLEFLEGHDLVHRDAHPTDRRTAFVYLTDKAREMLDAYFSETVATAL